MHEGMKGPIRNLLAKDIRVVLPLIYTDESFAALPFNTLSVKAAGR